MSLGALWAAISGRIKTCLKILTGLMWVLLFSSNEAIQAQGHRIEVNIEGARDSIGYLGHYLGNSRLTIDSARIGQEGSFLFEGPDLLPKGVYFVYSSNFFFEILVSDQRFSVETQGPQYLIRMITHDSEENEAYNQLQKFALQQQNLISSVRLSLAQVDSGNALVLALNKIEEDSHVFRKKLAEEHQGTFVGKVINSMTDVEVPDSLQGTSQQAYLKEHFFDNIDFSEPALLRTPVIVSRYTEYLDVLTSQNSQSLIESVDQIMAKVKAFPDFYRFTVSFLVQRLIQAYPEPFLHLAQKYILNSETDWMTPNQLALVSARVESLTPKYGVGNFAPDISMVGPDLDQFTLYSIPAKYLILYFYDPDCTHCQTGTPDLFDLYLNFQSKGLEVVAVCTTTDILRWRQFIDEHNLDWINGSDPFVTSDFRDEYKVYNTPMIFVLDSDKKILKVNVGMDELPALLDALDFQ